MKKIIALILAGLMMLTLVACNTTPDTDDKENDKVSDSEGLDNETPDNNDSDNETPDNNDSDNETPVTTDISLEAVATDLINKYGEYVNLRAQYDEYMASLENDEYATEEDKNMTFEQFASYQLYVNPVEKDAEFLMGFTEAPTGYSECYQYIPSSMNPFMGYVFRLEEGTDVEAFKKSLTDSCDLIWMICRAANTVVCENYGDIVMFQMCVVINEEFPDGFTEEQKQGFIDTFYAAVKTPADAE